MKSRRPHGDRCGLEALEARQLFAGGGLDPSFADNGRFVGHLNWDDVGQALAIQPDGKIVGVGSDSGLDHTNVGDPNVDAVFRLLPDGSPDPAFHPALDDRFLEYTFFDVALQPDGKIVLAGALPGDVDMTPMLARLNADGSLDMQFGSQGVLTPFGFDSAHRGVVTSIVPLPDGRVMFAGQD